MLNAMAVLDKSPNASKYATGASLTFAKGEIFARLLSFTAYDIE